MNTNQIKSKLTDFGASDLSQTYGIDDVNELTKILNKQIVQSFRKERIKSKIQNFFGI